MTDDSIFDYMNPFEDDETVEGEPDALLEEEWTTIRENEDE